MNHRSVFNPFQFNFVKKLAIGLLLLGLIVLLAACGNETVGETEQSETPASSGNGAEAETITVIHQLGETTVSKNPEKVVVFDFGILDSLEALDIPVVGVPQANVPSYLAKYEDASYEHVGSLKEPDFEKIAEIDPDLIIISGRQMEAYDELSKLGPTIFLGVDATQYMDSFKANMNWLGEIFDQQVAIDEALEQIQADIDELNAHASESGATALVILVNEGNISAYGPGSRFGLVYDTFGFEPVDPDIESSTHGMNISFEYLVEKDPDYLFVIDRDAALTGESVAQQTLENELVAKTKAYQNNQIYYLNADYWYLSGGGLISVSEMVNEMKAALE